MSLHECCFLSITLQLSVIFNFTVYMACNMFSTYPTYNTMLIILIFFSYCP